MKFAGCEYALLHIQTNSRTKHSCKIFASYAHPSEVSLQLGYLSSVESAQRESQLLRKLVTGRENLPLVTLAMPRKGIKQLKGYRRQQIATCHQLFGTNRTVCVSVCVCDCCCYCCISGCYTACHWFTSCCCNSTFQLN